MPQYSRLIYTKTTADAHNTPAFFRQQAVPTLIVLRDHTLPRLGLTLLNNHCGINNDTVTFRTPCIICICYTFRSCNVRSCILNTYQKTDSVQRKYPIQSKLGLKQPKCEDNHTLPSGNAEFKNAWKYSCTSPYVLMVLCLIQCRDLIYSLHKVSDYLGKF